MGSKILVIEDDKSIADLVKNSLEDSGYTTVLAQDGDSGLELALSGRFDLVILDIKLPGKDGLEICRTLRAQKKYIPILMLTSMSTELDRVLGLEIGADDYLTKPFSLRELLARIKALFRRIEAIESTTDSGPDPVYEIGDFIIDTHKREVLLKGAAIDLTAKEFDLFLLFAKNPGRVYTRTDLLDLVWGYAYKGYEHTVNSHINRLRSKIEAEPNKPRYILTVWSVGYKFYNPAEDKTSDV